VDAFLEQLVPGQIVYVKNGSYDQTAAGVDMAKDGTNTLPIIFEGFNTTHGDDPTGNNRPQIDMGTNGMNFDNYIHFRHMRVTNSSGNTLAGDIGFYIINCEVINTGTGADNTLDFGSSYGAVIDSYIECSFSGTGHSIVGYSGLLVKGNYIKGEHGIYIQQENPIIIDNIIVGDKSAGGTGINSIANLRNFTVMNNTIYNFEIGIDGANFTQGFIWSNLIDTCTTGINFNTSRASYLVVMDYNNFNGCTTDVTNVTKGSNATAINPSFTDAGNGDFSIGNTDLKGASYPYYFNNTSDSYIDVGAVQREESGGASSYGFIQ
jgi:hypothetical protein